MTTTYQVESRDHDTGLCMLWKAVPENVMGWIKAELPGPSAIGEVLGPPQEIYYWCEDD